MLEIYVPDAYESGTTRTNYFADITINNVYEYEWCNEGSWVYASFTVTEDTWINVYCYTTEEEIDTPTPHEVEVYTYPDNLEMCGDAWMEVDGTTYRFGQDFVVMSDADFKVHYILDIAAPYYGGYPTMSLYIDGYLWAQYCNDSTSYMMEDVIGISLDEYDEITLLAYQWISEEYIALPKIEDLPQVDQEFEEVFFDDKKYFLKTFTTNNSNSVNIDSEEKYIVKANIIKIA